jgi:nucleotide-binding universal stress UspA family protein
MFTHILVPHDGSRLSESALTQALELAKSLSARINVLHVITDFAGDPGSAVPLMAMTAGEAFQQRAIGEAEAILSRAKRLGSAHDVQIDTHYLLAADPFRAIVDESERLGCDLIMMASHGRRGFSALLLGSETQKVLTHCRTPVLVVRG